MNLARTNIAESRNARECFAEGNSLLASGDLDGAIRLYRQAVQSDTQYVDALYNLARALKDKGEHAAAADTFEKALSLSPQDAESWYMLGNVRREMDLIDDAVAAYVKALQQDPALTSAKNNLGVCLQSAGEIEGARKCFQSIVLQDPVNADAHHNLAMLHLSMGDYRQGWQEYEWRFHTSDRSNPERLFPAQRWHGEPLKGRSILITAEQGRGDAIQFVRFVPSVAERGGHVVLECQPELMRLFSELPFVHSVLPYGQHPPTTDFQIPLLSLPAELGTTLDSLPGIVPYIVVDKKRKEEWEARFSSDPSQLKVGLVWAGNPQHKNDLRRSIPSEMLEPLVNVPCCSFFSLQRESAPSADSEIIEHLPNPLRTVSDFADTAAVLANLDLVITVDTAIAHLAGGLGIPVWTLLPFFPDWRWMRERLDTPWYPTMRLYRQGSPGDWRGVISQVKHDLMLAAHHKNDLAGTKSGKTPVPESAHDSVEFIFDEAQKMHQLGRLTEAAQQYRQIIQRSPDHCGARNNLAVCLQHEGRLDEAIEQCREALRYSPQNVAVMNNLGFALCELGMFVEAEGMLREACAIDQSIPDVLNNLGNALKAQQRYDEAIACYRRAIHLRSEYVDPHWNLAQVCLLTGRMEEGWREYEWRWKKRDFTSPHRAFTQPLWDGSRLDGKTILLHAEQGFGDAIQFVRYAPLVRQHGGRILLECHRELYTLFQSLPEIDEVKVFGELLPSFDVHAPLMSLPLCMGTVIETIPARIPYLTADREREQLWSQRILPNGNRLRVGIVWSGNQHLKDLQQRSCPPEEFAALSDVQGVEWYSLQKQVGAEEMEAMQRHFPCVDLAEQLRDFADTAAAMTHLDLVITIDTAAAHLAGALGRPVWVLLHHDHDWRWMIDRDDCPWYPTMRLFRQIRCGDWKTVVGSVRSALVHLIAPIPAPRAEPPADNPATLNDRALALHNEGRFNEARDLFLRALARRPGEGAIHYNLGNTLRALDHHEEAVRSYQRSLELGLQRPEVYNNLGATLNSLSRWDGAKPVLQKAIALDQSFVMAYANLGYALLQQNLVNEAIEILEAAIRVRPDYADAHWLVSHCHLLLGRYAEGWSEYEWRWAKLDHSLYPYLRSPRWDGGPVAGKKILLFTEQGYGDGIQFVRYVPRLASLGAELMLECQPELVPLFRGVEGISQLIPRGEKIPDFDLQCPLMSLPRYLQATAGTAVNGTQYIEADIAKSAMWRERIRSQAGVLNVGLVWAGNPSHRNDAQRSISPGVFARLGEIPGVRYYNLQKGSARNGVDVAMSQVEFVDVAGELRDFGDTAALIQNLDLVISVDTAVAHCAGALGKAVWLLLPVAPDWRWMLGREDTPWYPTMRLFRQRQAGNWYEVVTRVREELCQVCKKGV